MKNRKITYKLYPTKNQEKRLFEVLELHRQLYNIALEQRIKVWKGWGKSVSYYDQCIDLIDLRQSFEDYKKLNAQSIRFTLKRLDRAFRGFFRRVKSNCKISGFPRFKSKERFRSFSYPNHINGWTLYDKIRKIRLSEVGLIKYRGSSRNQGIPKILDVIYKNGKWYASITIECNPVRNKGNTQLGLDWGVQTFATLVYNDNCVEKIENPRNFQNIKDKLKKKQQKFARCKPGSNNRNRQKIVIRNIYNKLANIKKDFLHKTSATIISKINLIATEKLNIQSMVEGSNSHNLNREILDTAPGMFLQMLKYKAEEAGVVWHEVNTKKVKPSQTCSNCFRQKKKELSERVHKCECGLEIDRDINAAKVMLLDSQGMAMCKDNFKHELLEIV